MKMLYGKPVADAILNDVAAEVALMSLPPMLGVICSDKNSPYYRGIVKDAKRCGISLEPLAGFYDGTISLDKEFTPPSTRNVDGGLMTPCTTEAVMELLKFYEIPIAGKDVCIVGRSERVGKPLARLMLDADATVTVCHSKTQNLADHIWNVDIVVTCTGVEDLLPIHDIFFSLMTNSTIVDIGGEFEKVKFADFYAKAPHIGGVGPVTRAVLMRHVLEKAKGARR